MAATLMRCARGVVSYGARSWRCRQQITSLFDTTQQHRCFSVTMPTFADVVATVESVKAVTEVFTPVSGKVVEINETLADDPSKINKSCYDVELSDMSKLDELMNEEQYKKFLETMD